MVFNDFRLTYLYKINQNSWKSTSKTWLVLDIDFGPLFLDFEIQNGSKMAPKSIQNREKKMRIIEPEGSWKQPESKTIQNDTKVFKSTPKTPPRPPKTTPKSSPEL